MFGNINTINPMMNGFKFEDLILKIKNALSDDLLKQGFGNQAHCYVASEAIYHLLGGKKYGLKPMNIKHEGVQHWFLQSVGGSIIDITADQFDSPVPYNKARGRGFLTLNPSSRAKILIERVR
jgi:hypothetical protein